MHDVVELSEQQRRLLIDSRQLWDGWLAALRHRAGYTGSMSWKRVKKGEYLVKIAPEGANAVRKMRSLGPRSPETEASHRAFTEGREAARARLETLSRRLAEQARLNKALDLGRVPSAAAKVLRELERQGLLGRNLMVIGTNAIFAYEAAAGVFVRPGLLATGDLDFLMDARARLRLGVEKTPPPRLIDALRSADPSYQRAPNALFRAVNAAGYQVDLVKVEPIPPWRAERSGFGEGDLVAAPIDDMKWVANAPRFHTVAIGADGYPVPIACPDTRAFALYKLWMGRNDPGRDPVKCRRDVEQAHAVADLVNAYFPHLPFEDRHPRSFPRRVVAAAIPDFFRP